MSNIVPQQDPDPYSFEDPRFAPLDNREGSDFANRLVEEFASPEEKAAIEQAENEQAQPAAEEEVASGEPEVEEQSNEPTVLEFNTGKAIIERGPTGLTATLILNEGGGNQVFHATDESSLMRELLAAQVNATAKIRSQNKQLKSSVRKTEQVSQPSESTSKELTADEVFEIKTALDSNPDLAMAKWFQKRTGMSVEELVKLAKSGRNAEEAFYVQTESRAFVADHPEYLNTDENYRALLGYLCQEYLGTELSDDANPEPLLDSLVKKGKFNRDTLGEAFDQLSEAGLLEMRQVESPAPPEPKPVVKPAPVAAPKIATPPAGIPTKVRPRVTAANFGLRQRSTTGAQPQASDQVLSVEELDNMSNEEVNKLMEGVLTERARQYRRK